ncbi:MAG TPA: hypothetical protein VF322_12610 [Gammaproteobacteria bacterium]
MTMRRNIWPICAAAALALGPLTAQAIPITYDFSVTATAGPLAGTTATGFFTFDDAIIPPGGGTVEAANLLTDLAFTWNGIAYDETTANTGLFTFAATGDPLEVAFGTTCVPGLCALVGATNDWMVGRGAFAYTLPGVFAFYDGTVSFTRRPVEVPEPEH